jgi:hypothetical protein
VKNHEAIMLLVNAELERCWCTIAMRSNNGDQNCWCCGEQVGAYCHGHKPDCEAARAEKMVAALKGKPHAP